MSGTPKSDHFHLDLILDQGWHWDSAACPAAWGKVACQPPNTGIDRLGVGSFGPRPGQMSSTALLLALIGSACIPISPTSAAVTAAFGKPVMVGRSNDTKFWFSRLGVTGHGTVVAPAQRGGDGKGLPCHSRDGCSGKLMATFGWGAQLERCRPDGAIKHQHGRGGVHQPRPSD